MRTTAATDDFIFTTDTHLKSKKKRNSTLYVLPWQGKRKPNGKKERREKQAFRRDLRERADVYPNFETEFGHLEGDTIVGKNHKSAVITLVEKQSKAMIVLQSKGRKASDIESAINQWMSRLYKYLFY